MLDIDELPDDIRKLARKTNAIRRGNAQAIAKMEQVGVGFDLSTARLEHFMGSLIDLGIITDAQYWAMNLEWEESLQHQLEKAWRKIANQMHEQKQAQDAAAARAAIALPERPGLIVPGQ